MKSTVNKITDSAKRRDTIGRNRVQAISLPREVGTELFQIQNENSSDSVEKVTNIIIKDQETSKFWLLKYRILTIAGGCEFLSAMNEELFNESTTIDEDAENLERGENDD